MKIKKYYKIFFFPKYESSTVANILIILPKRLAFKLIYYFKKNDFNKKKFFEILKAISLITLIGIPFVLIKISYYFIKTKSIQNSLQNVSKDEEIKLVILGNETIRNMRLQKQADLADKLVNRINREGSIFKGLAPGKKLHAIAFEKDSEIGILYSSKKLNEEPLIQRDINSFAYIQTFGENEYIPQNQIKNSQLISILEKHSTVDVLGSLVIAKNTENFIVRHNQKKEQFLLKIEKNKIKKATNFLEKHGGEEDIKDVIKYIQYYNESIIEGENLIFKLSNKSKKDRFSHIANYQNSREKLKILSNSIKDEEKKKDLEKIIIKLDKLMSPDTTD